MHKQLAVRTGVKAGRITANHNQGGGLKVRTGVKAGAIAINHNASRRVGIR